MAKQRLGKMQKKWVEALESGRYRQAKGKLKDGRAYCCLGVACVVTGLRAGNGYDPEAPDVPRSVVQDLALIGSIGEFGDHPAALDIGWDDLANYNDEGATFAEIAAFIRANPEAVFTEPK